MDRLGLLATTRWALVLCCVVAPETSSSAVRKPLYAPLQSSTTGPAGLRTLLIVFTVSYNDGDRTSVSYIILNAFRHAMFNPSLQSAK